VSSIYDQVVRAVVGALDRLESVASLTGRSENNVVPERYLAKAPSTVIGVRVGDQSPRVTAGSWTVPAILSAYAPDEVTAAALRDAAADGLTVANMAAAGYDAVVLEEVRRAVESEAEGDQETARADADLVLWITLSAG
jgi:hypothetical protein